MTATELAGRNFACSQALSGNTCDSDTEPVTQDVGTPSPFRPSGACHSGMTCLAGCPKPMGLIYGAGFQPLMIFVNLSLGRCPRLVWIGPPALWRWCKSSLDPKKRTQAPKARTISAWGNAPGTVEMKNEEGLQARSITTNDKLRSVLKWRGPTLQSGSCHRISAARRPFPSVRRKSVSRLGPPVLDSLSNMDAASRVKRA